MPIIQLFTKRINIRSSVPSEYPKGFKLSYKAAMTYFRKLRVLVKKKE